MRSIAATAELLDVARRVVWYKTPEQALEDTTLFLARVMTYGTDEDVVTVRRSFSDDELRRVLDDPPTGTFDKRSWAYWNLVLGRTRAPPLPTREARLAGAIDR